ncbi:MAG: hypothetical protein ACLUOI_11315 [Eisenbergiella sp.]
MVDDHTGFLIYIEIYGDVGMDTDDNLNEAFQGVTLIRYKSVLPQKRF